MLDNAPTVFRDAVLADVPRLVELGKAFFAESEFPDFTEYDPEGFELTVKKLINDPSYFLLTFAPVDEVEGFIAFSLDSAYTKDPLALLFLLYVTPGQRKTPAGRLLVDAAEAVARDNGAVAFYAGAMSGVPGTTKSIANMYQKLGFESTDFWGRKILWPTLT